MGAFVFQAFGQVEVVGQVVLGVAWAGNISGIANTSFRHAIGALADRADAHLHSFHPVEGVEDTEDVDARFGGLFDELDDQVVGVSGVAYGIGAAQQHLKTDIGNGLAEKLEPLPGAFLEEAQGHVEGGATPYFHGEYVIGVVLCEAAGYLHHIVGAHPGGQQRLVRIAEGGVRVLNGFIIF